MNSGLHLFFGIFGNATALFLFLSPTVTFRRIVERRSTEEFSGIPYMMTLLNCLLSTWYALPFVSPNNMLLCTINVAGALISLVFVTIFIVYSPTNKRKLKMFSLVLLLLLVLACDVLVSLLALDGPRRKTFCGVAATISATAMYAGPLSIVRMVIRTKSVEYMPLLLSVFVFLCSTSWFVYGLIGHDLFVVIPNGFGCGLGAVQLILYMIYYDKNATPAIKKTTDGEDREMDTHAQNKQPSDAVV